jgi:hypothetical protein
MDQELPEVLREGYATEDGEHWICPECVAKFRDEFEWKFTDA